MDEDIMLSSITYKFSQKNYNDSNPDSHEYLFIEVQGENILKTGGYFIINTASWTITDPKDFIELLYLIRYGVSTNGTNTENATG